MRFSLYLEWQKFCSDYNNKRAAHMPCLVFRGGHRFKAEGRMGTGSLHPWYPAGAPGNRFDLASVVKEPVRQTNKVCQIANIDAVFGRMRCSWSARAHFFGHFQIHVSWTG